MRIPSVEIITIGNEILSGKTLNTNARDIARALGDIGLTSDREVVVGDKEEHILDALRAARAAADVVIVTGGLGPTSDDITKDCLAIFFNKKLHQGALRLPNEVGCATGVWMDLEDFLCISLPGVPQEMETMLRQEVLPRLRERFRLPKIVQRSVHTIGARESIISEKLAALERVLPSFISLSYLPHVHQVSVVLTTRATDEPSARRFDKAYTQLLQALNGHVYGVDDDTIAQKIGERLLEQGLTVAAAESCTGGSIAAMLTGTSGSSRYFAGGIVAYQRRTKERLLHIKQHLETYGEVSEETASEMAKSVRKVLQAGIGIASTGVMETMDKHRGHEASVWVAVADDKTVRCERRSLSHNRTLNTESATWSALELLWRHLNNK